MGKRLGRALGFTALLAVIVLGSACNKNKNPDVVSQVGDGGGPPAGMGGGPPGMMGGPRGRGPIGQTMAKLFRGRPSLKDSIGQELNSDSPSWDMIQPQTKEFAELAASLNKYNPPKGSKDSWEKLTASFSKEAAALAHAAAAKNKDEALAVYSRLTDNQTTCKACHQAHKGGPGGMGGPPGGFRGPGGPPKGPPTPPQE